MRAFLLALIKVSPEMYSHDDVGLEIKDTYRPKGLGLVLEAQK